MIPSTIMELMRKASGISLSHREIEGIRRSLENGRLKKVLERKYMEDSSHPPYIRVACTTDEIGFPVILEIWPGQHYSPIHSHGGTKGIIYCLIGKLEVMLYDKLVWNAEKLGLLTLSKGDCAWLNEKNFPVHKVDSSMPKGSFSASLHAYLNKDELPLLQLNSRDKFDFVHEESNQLGCFKTESDLTWSELSTEINKWASEQEFCDN